MKRKKGRDKFEMGFQAKRVSHRQWKYSVEKREIEIPELNSTYKVIQNLKNETKKGRLLSSYSKRSTWKSSHASPQNRSDYQSEQRYIDSKN